MYTCNVTGNTFSLENEEKYREGGLRFGCQSRFRAIAYIFTKIFYGECKILSNLNSNKNLKGIGMSDGGSYADILTDKFNYINTYYHTEPYLDINNAKCVNSYNNLDFIISTDVFEHVEPYPSLQLAFDNLYKMLKNGGVLIFSVPYTENEHKEHFPNLYKYEIKYENGNFVLYNTTVEGKSEVFDKLCFHGGPGTVLEMRIFSKKSIISFLENSGFIDITFNEITDDMRRYGIFWSSNDCNGGSNTSLIVTAKKPI